MKFKPIYVIKSKLNSLPRARGQYVIVTDTGEVYFDRTDNERVLIANKYILPAATNAALGGIKSGSAISVASDGTVSIPGSGHTHPIGNIEGVTVSAKEVNFLAGASSNIQTAIESKVPKATTVNGKALIGNISLTASDVSAVPLTRTINNKALGSNISLNADDVGALSTGARGSTVASLENGKVPSSQLPSFVDDVIEGYYANSKFYSDSGKTNAITGETGKIYVDLTSNKTYRWSGSAYVEISASLALGTTASTAFAGDKGNTLWTNYGTGVNKGSATTPVYIANGVPTAMTGALPISLGGTGASNATSARSNLGLGNVATYNLFDISGSTTAGFDTTRIAKIDANGVMEVGRYIDFHYNNTASDYASRITCDSNGNLALTSGKTITATNFSGLASSASKLTTNAGSTTQPIYFAEGIPKAITGNIANGTTGNAATATKLKTSRIINGTSFDGTEDITTFKWGTERPITIGNTQKYVDGSNTGGYKWTVAEIGAVNRAGDEMSGNLTIYSTNPTLKIQNSSEGPSNLILERGNNTHSDWKIINTGGNLIIQNDYTTAVGDYFNVLSLAYNTGNATFKGTISAGGTVTAPAFQGNASSASKLTSNAGSTTQPIYFADGVPKAITGNINNGTNGNAATATKLETIRTINGTNFDGTANITTANWGTTRTLVIGNMGKNVNGGGNVTWTLDEIGAVNKAGDTMSGALQFSHATKDVSSIPVTMIYGRMGSNDSWRIAAGAKDYNQGYLEIATDDDGSEPIYVRQYSGGGVATYSTINKAITLLDGAGKSHFRSVGIGTTSIEPSSSPVELQYNSTYSCLKFVFA